MNLTWADICLRMPFTPKHPQASGYKKTPLAKPKGKKKLRQKSHHGTKKSALKQL